VCLWCVNKAWKIVGRIAGDGVRFTSKTPASGVGDRREVVSVVIVTGTSPRVLTIISPCSPTAFTSGIEVCRESGRSSATGMRITVQVIPMLTWSQTFWRRVNELTVSPRKVISSCIADNLYSTPLLSPRLNLVYIEMMERHTSALIPQFLIYRCRETTTR
jgi:hypothetical protein